MALFSRPDDAPTACLPACDGLLREPPACPCLPLCPSLPVAQKEVVRLCRQMGKPVIIASHLLQSMHTLPTPTRAEVSGSSPASACPLLAACCAVLCCADFPHCRVASDLLLSMPAEFRLTIFSLGCPCPCPCCSAGQRCGRLRAPAGRRADAVRGDCGWGLPSQVSGGAAQRSHAHRGVGEVSGRGWVAAGWVGEMSGALGCWGVERWVGLTSNRRLLTASTFDYSVLCFSSPHARFDTPDPQTPLPCNPRPRCACAAGRRSTGG
jgi:hypothetical protein